MGEFVSIDEYEAHAAKVLPKMVYGYYRSGADDEVTLRRNRSAFNKLIIRPRFLRDVSVRETSVSLLGDSIILKSPICVAPTASQRLAHPDGEIATARACKNSGTLMCVSTIATTSLEDIAKSAPNSPRFFQLYVYKDREETRKLVNRVEKAGYKALVLTVDTPFAGKRRDDLRNKYSLPPHLRMANFETDATKTSEMKASGGSSSGFAEYVKKLFDPALEWKDVTWLTQITRLPVIVKGILTAEDANLAVSAGVSGIIVSNHGARQLDSVPATIEALPEVVSAVNKRCDVYIDGGIRTGNDVFKAIGMGAKAVFIGRPVLWGLAHSGHNGVEKVLKLLNEEFDLAMALSGCKNISDICRKNVVVHESRYSKL